MMISPDLVPKREIPNSKARLECTGELMMEQESRRAVMIVQHKGLPPNSTKRLQPRMDATSDC